MMKIKITFLLLGASFCTLFAQKQYTLEDCRQMAIDNNKGLKMSQEKITQGHSKNKAAFTKYLPELSFTGTYMYNSKNIALISDTKTSPNPIINGIITDLRQSTILDVQNVFAGVLTLSQPIYVGGKIRAYNKITQYSEELAKMNHNTNYEETILKTDELYWQVISLENKRKLAESYVKLVQKMDSDVSIMVETGVATKADQLSVKVKLNQAETTKAKVENGLNLTRMALCQVCGLGLQEQISLIDEQTKVNEQPIILEDYKGKSAARSELKSLNLANKIYKEKENVVRADMLPKVLLTGNYIISNPNLYNGFETKFSGMFNVGVAVQIPIFHWGETYHEMKAARSESRVIKLEYEEAKEKIELQVQQSVFKINESIKRLEDSKRNIERADENLKYATTGFESGVIPASSLLEAQTAWLQANSELIDAEIDVRLCKTYLAKAIGQLTAK